eukprot:1282869-Rhodomonas_salina.3
MDGVESSTASAERSRRRRTLFTVEARMSTTAAGSLCKLDRRGSETKFLRIREDSLPPPPEASWFALLPSPRK